MSVPQVSERIYDKTRTMDNILVVVKPATYILTNPHAHPPEKQDNAHVGHDITLISRTENRVDDINGHINSFNTGIELKPPQGYHFEIYPKRSLYKSGYSMPCPQIVEPTDKGPLIVDLMKFTEQDQLDLPVACVVAVLRETQYCLMTTQTVKVKKYEKVEEDEDSVSFTTPPKFQEKKKKKQSFS